MSLLQEPDDTNALAEAAEQEIIGWEQEGMRFITLLDQDYPAQLLTVHQRPPFLMMRGRPDEADAQGVAIVGTRKATDRGVREAYNLARELSSAGVPVISGLAVGIDTAALSGALSAGGRAVAVIGTGLHHAYPNQNSDLQDWISKVGLVISQFLPDTPPVKSAFPMRNAVMSGYSAATVVVEAPYRSGARMQARLALEHGRRVFLVESLLVNDWARSYANRPNTTVVRSVNDVLAHLESPLAVDQDLVWS
jgi:DNA processing protein